MAKKPIKKQTKKTGDSKTQAFVATFLSIIGFIIALLAWKDDKYTMYYAKQSLVVFITWVVVGLVGWVIGRAPIIGPVIVWVLGVFILVLWIISWIYALSGKEKEVPIVGMFAEKINL
jgi:uncharacterized membrane protein